MKNTILLVVLVAGMHLSPTFLRAQEDYSSLDIGWKQLVDTKAPPKSEKYDRWSYSAEQMHKATLLLSWMQQTYTPRGCLGVGRRTANTKPDQYDSTVIAEPHRYGAIGRFYHDLRKDANGKWIATSNTYHFLRVVVNGNVGENFKLISTPEHHYFTLPGMRPGDEYFDKRVNFLGFGAHPMLSKYPHFLSPFMNADASGYTVILSPGRGLPYHPVPKGEYLQRLKERIIRQHAGDLQKIAEDVTRSNKAQWNKEENERFAERMAAWDRLYAKYKSRLNEPTILATVNGTYLLENDKGNDIFTPTDANSGTPVYAFDADKVAKCKSDEAQWIVITWTDITGEQEVENHFMRTILARFDFDYVYNYFFDPEKVKGKEYKPL